jgi:hypothetical protein
MIKTLVVNSTSLNANADGIHDMIADAIGENKKEIVLNRMNHNTVIENLRTGRLKGIKKDMKISKSTFYNCRTTDEKEIIVQLSNKKITIFL